MSLLQQPGNTAATIGLCYCEFLEDLSYRNQSYKRKSGNGLKVVAFREVTGFCPLVSVGSQHGGISDHNLFKVSVCKEQPENRIHKSLRNTEELPVRLSWHIFPFYTLTTFENQFKCIEFVRATEH